MHLRSENRRAIVIGNSDYDGKAHLPNPVNDARAVHKALQELGFQTIFAENLNYRALKGKLDEFEKTLKNSGPVDTVLIYFSGHGLQYDNENYLVPIGAELGDKSHFEDMVKLQDYVDRITKHSDKRLVFLDTCRNNPILENLSDEFAKHRGITNKGYQVAGQQVKTPADSNTATNTFLAFAAAPGEYAYDGDGQNNSPFTQALINHIGAVDLPLTNLMVRVRNEVLKATDNKQKTWDNTSLTDAFFFNPSTFLMLIGNFIGLLALCFSLVPYSLLLAEGNHSSSWVLAGVAIIILALSLFLRGLHNAYARLRGEGRLALPDKDIDQQIKQKQKQNLGKGIYGGTMAGIIGPIAIAIPYYYISPWEQFEEAKTLATLLTEITLTTIFVSVVFGVSGLLGPDLFNRLVNHTKNTTFSFKQAVITSLLAGLVAGLLTGPVVTAYFGSMDRPFIEPLQLVPGALLVAAFVVFTVINYSLEKFTIQRLKVSAMAIMKALAISLPLAAVIGLIIIPTGSVDYIFDISSNGFHDPFNSTFIRFSFLFFGGAVYGLMFGPILALLFGLSMYWTPEETRGAMRTNGKANSFVLNPTTM